MTTTTVFARHTDVDEKASRWSGAIAVLVGHALVVVALLQVDSVQESLIQTVQAMQVEPIFVQFVAPPQPPTAQAPAPASTPLRSSVRTKEPAPVITTRPEPTPVQPAPATADTSAPESPTPPQEAAPSPSSTSAVQSVQDADSAPAMPAAAPAIKTTNKVQYIRPPRLEYPAVSRRLNEQGRVLLRVLINRSGVAEQVDVQASSGSSRLDQAAIKATREALYRPQSENGETVAVWALVPVVFELSEQ